MEIEYTLLLYSAILGVGFNLLFQWIFIKRKKFDPIKARSSHSALATKTGGIALFSSLFVCTLYFYFNRNEIFDFTLLLPLSTIFIIGVYDDFYEADFKLKFFIQIIVAKLFIDNGFLINNYYGLFGFQEIPYLLAQLTTIFVFLVIVNAFNFIDGIDGLAISFAIFALIGFEFLNHSSALSSLNTISIGGLLSLYYFNFKKERKIFLGDAGSLFLGSLLAVNAFHYLDSSQLVVSGNRVLLSVGVLFYPLVDLLRVFILRISQKKSPFVADKKHIHHELSKISKNHFIRSLIIVSLNFTIVFLIKKIL
jgi:UDP-N-acetylmuramyl pentapeptide phosphotransferase/UDP-N-acetylglucosamine-1-phosphate transferase